MGSAHRRYTPFGAALAWALLLAAACQPATDADDVTAPSPAADSETAHDDPDDGADDAEDEADDQSPRGGDGGDLREPLTLDIQQAHANGTVVRILGARFLSNAIELEVEILNGAPRDVFLHHVTHQPFHMHLLDDAGNRYALNPPPDNEMVTVDEGQRLQGTLTFLGRVDPAATELTLHTYGGHDGDPGSQNPLFEDVKMSLAIPLGDG